MRGQHGHGLRGDHAAVSWLSPFLQQPHAACGVLLSMALSLAACGDGAQPGSTPSPVEVAEPARSRAQPAGDARLRSALKTLPRAARSRSMQGLVRVQTADGPIKLNLEGRFQHASVAVVDAQGGLHATCVDGASESSASE